MMADSTAYILGVLFVAGVVGVAAFIIYCVAKGDQEDE